METYRNHMVVSWNRGTPSHHPFADGIFLYTNPPACLGYPHDFAGNRKAPDPEVAAGPLGPWAPGPMHRPIQVEVVRGDEGIQPEEVADAKAGWDGSWGIMGFIGRNLGIWGETLGNLDY